MAAFSDPEVMAALQDGRHFTMFASFILVVALIFLSSPRSAIYGVFHHFHPSTIVAFDELGLCLLRKPENIF